MLRTWYPETQTFSINSFIFKQILLWLLITGPVGALFGLFLGYVNQLACRTVGIRTALPYRLAWLIPAQFGILGYLIERFYIETFLTVAAAAGQADKTRVAAFLREECNHVKYRESL